MTKGPTANRISGGRFGGCSELGTFLGILEITGRSSIGITEEHHCCEHHVQYRTFRSLHTLKPRVLDRNAKTLQSKSFVGHLLV